MAKNKKRSRCDDCKEKTVHLVRGSVLECMACGSQQRRDPSGKTLAQQLRER